MKEAGEAATTLASVRTTDEEAISAAVHDYYEGWYDADVARMQRALHPELAKRFLEDADGAELRTTTAQRMFELTAQGAGREDGADRTIDVDVVDVYRNIASVIVRAAMYHEYIQLARTPEGWKIVNVLWQRR
jgi:hypothetical protein